MTKVQRQWGVVTKVLKKTGVKVRAQTMMYKAVVQAILMCGRNILVMTEAMLKVLDWFHHCVARRIEGMSSGRVGEEGWE